MEIIFSLVMAALLGVTAVIIAIVTDDESEDI